MNSFGEMLTHKATLAMRQVVSVFSNMDKPNRLRYRQLTKSYLTWIGMQRSTLHNVQTTRPRPFYRLMVNASHGRQGSVSSLNVKGLDTYDKPSNLFVGG